MPRQVHHGVLFKKYIPCQQEERGFCNNYIILWLRKITHQRNIKWSAPEKNEVRYSRGMNNLWRKVKDLAVHLYFTYNVIGKIRYNMVY